MKFKLGILKILTFVIFIITIYEIRSTYAIFYSQMQGTSKNDIGKWNIEINSTNISSGINETFLIENLNIDSNINVKQGKLAPGSNGSFDIVINPTNTDVSIRYDITIDESKITTSGISLLSIEETLDLESLLIRTGEYTYTGIIPLSKINGYYLNNIKVKFSWINDELNNIEDSYIGNIKDNRLDIPITVNVTQYLGENILEYEK